MTTRSAVTRRVLEISHTTSYTYDTPVERSSHVFRLSPVHGPLQRVLAHEVKVSAAGTRYSFEDVFGNEAIGFEVSKPYIQLTISARSVVEVRTALDRPELLPAHHRWPLVWMPWQQQMLTPYLLPSELPENQLRQLGEYARSFADRNDQALLATLDDLNATIHRDFAYTPGFTTVETTPFQVFTTRAGVCQDFANLFICVARLLDVPARYRVGYLYTGTDYANTIQADASHAWVEVYLPFMGWRGYDPTNGVAVGADHVRVATGRNYRDATPTSGVVLRGGGGERLALEVRTDERTADYP